MLTYLPLELNENNCVVFIDNDIVRVYDSLYDPSNSNSFTDYYITDHYTFITGMDDTYAQRICLDHDNFTTNVFYRYDLSDILVSFSCIFFVSIFLIYFAMKCFFKGFFK